MHSNFLPNLIIEYPNENSPNSPHETVGDIQATSKQSPIRIFVTGVANPKTCSYSPTAPKFQL